MLPVLCFNRLFYEENEDVLLYFSNPTPLFVGAIINRPRAVNDRPYIPSGIGFKVFLQ